MFIEIDRLDHLRHIIIEQVHVGVGYNGIDFIDGAEQDSIDGVVVEHLPNVQEGRDGGHFKLGNGEGRPGDI